MLAATGARYSRNNEGLDAILSKIDPDDHDRSVDSIFRMIDYGHQSIADMAPVAMFIDDISMCLAYHVWTLCATAGGQESSTRYIELSPDAMDDPAALGVPREHHDGWRSAMEQAFSAYRRALATWSRLGDNDPALTRIPRALLDDTSPSARRQVDRMRRNYAFDRARYLLPFACPTNMMLVMSARGWVTLCRNLSSQPLPEGHRLAEAIRGQLRLATPRLVRHAVHDDSLAAGIQDEFTRWVAAAQEPAPALDAGACPDGHAPLAHLELLPPPGIDGRDLVADLAHHSNRYAWIGSNLQRTAVRFGWEAVAMAEIRDLNRHRTGSKHCPLVPVGFYAALDQIPTAAEPAERDELQAVADVGRSITARARALLAAGDPAFIHWTLLGTQFPFEHTTTADKFLYEAELRTGVGAHYRYARHLHDALALWYARYPETRGWILEGSAEPE